VPAYVSGGRVSNFTMASFVLNEGSPLPLLVNGNVTVGTPSAPSAPTLVSPANAATGVPVNPVLTWSSVSGATSYRLQVSAQSGFVTTFLDASGIGGTSRTVTGLSYATTYYWRVDASNSGGTSGWSATWSFTTKTGPRISVLPARVNLGNVKTGTIKDTTVTINNSGGDTLFISGISSNNTHFALKSVASGIAPGGSLVDSISFAPSNPGGDSARIIISSNGVNGPDTIVALGTGFNPSAPSPLIAVQPARVNFGNVRTGTIKDTAVTIQNLGGDTLFISSISSNNSHFALKSVTSGIAPGASLVDSLSFAPSNPGADSARIIILSNSGNGPDTVVALGTGFVPSAVEEGGSSPKSYSLEDNYPNPFNPSTNIRYSVPQESFVILKVFNILGQEVATIFSGHRDAGTYTTMFDGSHLASGVYLLRIDATADGTKDFVQIKRMVLVK